MTTHINFEIAKLLKDKGFNNIECNAYYHICDGYTKGYSFCYSNVIKQDDEGILAPTIAQIIIWLYEKYGIWVVVSLDWGSTNTFSYKIIGKRISSTHKFFLKSPTEAYEAAIEYTLKNLIECNQETK